MRDRLFTCDLKSQLLIELARLRQRFNRDTEMVNGVHGNSWEISFLALCR